MTALEQALEAQSVPGTNLKGSVDGANWCFLLPRLELGRVLAVGCLAPSSLARVAKLGDEVAVWARVADHDRLHLHQGLAGTGPGDWDFSQPVVPRSLADHRLH